MFILFNVSYENILLFETEFYFLSSMLVSTFSIKLTTIDTKLVL